ncbi:fibronectin type III domain-containing protein [Limnohabitans sp.]|uniref:fibronectin type III domain-containing protein n=1 Tax=Limnohabitans sp. TaxID=1907725 RepID=UPI0038B8728C
MKHGLRFVLSVSVLFGLVACGGGGGGGPSTTSVPGAPTVGAATAGSGQASVAFTAPSSKGGAAITSYAVSCITGSSSAVTASGSSSPITVTGLTNASAYSCTVTATNSVGTSAASSAVSVTPVASSVALSYTTPANFETLVAKAYTPSSSLTATSTVTNRARYMVSDAATASTSSNYLAIGTTYSDSTTAGYTVTTGTLSSSSTYNDYLTKTIQLVAASDGYYRLDSHLHPNNSIDVDTTTNTLKFRNVFGKTSATANGYVTFSYDASTHLLQAKNRYIYSYASASAAIPFVASYTLDSSFTGTGTGKYVSLSSGAYALATTGTPLYLYPTPLDLGIPSFMNPQAVNMVSNTAAPFKSKITYTSTEVVTRIKSNVKTAYQSQIASVGTDAATKTAADAMLVTIKSALEGTGEKLRYAPAVYTAFRDAALATKLVSDSISDGTPGQNLVPYVYFTNEQDTSGKYHPFMVVVNYGNQASPNGLKDIPRPPGDGTQPYGSGKVTRYSNLENYVSMIPMKDYGQVTAVTENTFSKTLWSDVSGTTKSKDVYTYASTADNGLLIDGSVMFPIFNNTLVPAPLVGELSASGCHVGQGGGGPHCHADGYQASAGLGLYNDADYVGVTHPPLIGFGYDGIALFASYRTSDTSLKGYGTLDAFGGHNHDDIGYHYHAHTVVDYQPEGESASLKSTLHVLMKGAYIGKTSLIPCFMTSSNFSNNKYMGGTPTSSCSP